MPLEITFANFETAKGANMPDGDRDAHSLIFMRGLALDHWEIMEHVMSYFFGELITGGETGAELYGEIISSSIRIRLMFTAWDVRKRSVDTEYHRQFSDTLATYQKLATKRNSIAHGITALVVEPGENGKLIDRGMLIIPPRYKLRKFKGQIPTYAYNGPKIEEFCQDVKKIFNQINRCRIILRGENPDEAPQLQFGRSVPLDAPLDDLIYQSRQGTGDSDPSPQK